MKRKFPKNKYDSVLKYKPMGCKDVMETYLHTFKNLKDTVVYIWYKNGSSFWYYVKYVNNNTVEGYIMSKNGWAYKKLNIKNIIVYY